jgi:hypothetical protein
MFSCRYDNEEDLYPLATCDTLNVTFSGTIAPILANNCLTCHSNSLAASSGNNIRLENYADVHAMSVSILGAINHQPPYSPMPKNGRMLNDCLITQFEIWVREGALNN